MEKIGVIGAGSWGTALARLLVNKGHECQVYIRDEAQLKVIEETGVNEKYLSGVELPEALDFTTDLKRVVEGADILLFSVPTASFRSTLQKSLPFMRDDQIIVNVAKGIENDTLMRVSEIAEELAPRNTFVTLSGPSHAEEVGTDHPTTVTVASKDIDAAMHIQNVFSTDVFRVYTNEDLIGVELGGALKNIIALAAGISDGMGYGDNTKAALMTRGITEMARLAKAMGAETKTFFGLSGVGDLIVTCTSLHSRNRRAGILIGQGMTADEATEHVGMVVEGIKTTKSVYDLLDKYDVEMPISEAMYKILFKDYDVNLVLQQLMLRERKDETEGLEF